MGNQLKRAFLDRVIDFWDLQIIVIYDNSYDYDYLISIAFSYVLLIKIKNKTVRFSAKCHLEMKKYEEAKDFGQKALEFANESKDEAWQLNATIIIAKAESEWMRKLWAICKAILHPRGVYKIFSRGNIMNEKHFFSKSNKKLSSVFLKRTNNFSKKTQFGLNLEGFGQNKLGFSACFSLQTKWKLAPKEPSSTF